MLKNSDERPKKNHPMDILLVEDSPADVKITLRAFSEVKSECKLYVVNDGQDALDFIYNKGEYKDKSKFPRPDLILLDINMPKMNGFEVLENLKSDLEYSSIPVVMLTSSRNEEDIAKSYRKNAASYIPKPVNYKDFVKIVDAFILYWTNVNRLPSEDSDIK